MAGKLLAGWFMECLACKATFIRRRIGRWDKEVEFSQMTQGNGLAAKTPELSGEI